MKLDAPEELQECVKDIHLNKFYGVLSNDWIFENILTAFEELEADDLDNISIEPDCYNSDLRKWVDNSFAPVMIDEAQDEGIVRDQADFWERVSAGQILAKRYIYEAVNDFLGDREVAQNE